jgi:hypothetical protein
MRATTRNICAGAILLAIANSLIKVQKEVAFHSALNRKGVRKEAQKNIVRSYESPVTVPNGYTALLESPFYVYEELLWLDAKVGKRKLTNLIREGLITDNPYSDDVWFMLAALAHPQRTMDPSKAKLFVVPTLSNLLLSLPRDTPFCWRGMCRTRTLREQANNFLLQSPWFQRHQGRDHVMVGTHPRSSQVLPSYPAFMQCNVLGMENRGWNNPDRYMVPSYYVGSPCQTEGKKRAGFALVANVTAPLVQNHDLLCDVAKEREEGSCGRTPKCPALAESRFAFHIAEEHYGSNRLMDTLLSGSVPVFTMKEQYEVLPDWIDWEKLSYFADVSKPTAFLQSIAAMKKDRSLYEDKVASIQANRHLFDWQTVIPFDTYMYMFLSQLEPEYRRTDMPTSSSALIQPKNDASLAVFDKSTKNIWCGGANFAPTCGECPSDGEMPSLGCGGMCQWFEYVSGGVDAPLDHQPQCLSMHDHCSEPDFDRVVEDSAKAYQPWLGEPYEWCVEDEDEVEARGYAGILLAKTFKTASTTAAAVTIHIAERVAQRKKLKTARCQIHTHHGFSRKNRPKYRGSPSVLWSSVREPGARALSAYSYYILGKRKTRQEDKDLLMWLDGVKNHQFVQLRTQRGLSADGGKATLFQLTEDSNQTFARILREEIMPLYDFIAVQERMDESLVVLKLLWGLEDGDIVVSSANGGPWKKNWNPRGSCFYNPNVDRTPEVEEYLSTRFRQGNADYLLHAIANQSLDLTIDVLGRERVKREVQKHVKLRALATERCIEETTFPCSETGEWQADFEENCYEFDEGCGHKCMDRVLDEYERGEIALDY